MNAPACTLDLFLGGKITLAQPREGFRAGHDSVLLAAAVPALAGQSVLELGAGVGVASLCLVARVAGCSVFGIEIDPDLARLANENAARNGVAARTRFEPADVAKYPLPPASFDHVFFNPPFHPGSGPSSPNRARARAKRDDANAVAAWTFMALAAVKPGGTVTAILRADRKQDMLVMAKDNDAVVFPLLPHRGEPPKRLIIRLMKSENGTVRTVSGLVLHGAGGKPSAAAEAVLRHGAALVLEEAPQDRD